MMQVTRALINDDGPETKIVDILLAEWTRVSELRVQPTVNTNMYEYCEKIVKKHGLCAICCSGTKAGEVKNFRRQRVYKSGELDVCGYHRDCKECGRPNEWVQGHTEDDYGLFRLCGCEDSPVMQSCDDGRGFYQT